MLSNLNVDVLISINYFPKSLLILMLSLLFDVYCNYIYVYIIAFYQDFSPPGDIKTLLQDPAQHCVNHQRLGKTVTPFFHNNDKPSLLFILFPADLLKHK